MAGQTEKWLVITGHSSLFAALLRLLQQKKCSFPMYLYQFMGGCLKQCYMCDCG